MLHQCFEWVLILLPPKDTDAFFLSCFPNRSIYQMEVWTGLVAFISFPIWIFMPVCYFIFFLVGLGGKFCKSSFLNYIYIYIYAYLIQCNIGIMDDYRAFLQQKAYCWKPLTKRSWEMVNFLEALIVCSWKYIGDDYLKIIENSVCSSKQTTVFFYNRGCSGQFMSISTNPTGPWS